MFESEDGMSWLLESCGSSVHGAESGRLVLYRKTIFHAIKMRIKATAMQRQDHIHPYISSLLFFILTFANLTPKIQSRYQD
jgi:hypothetical protein